MLYFFVVLNIQFQYMKKLAILFLLAGSSAYAQRNFTIEETVFGARSFAPQSLRMPKWIPNQQAFSYIEPSNNSLTIRSESTKWNPETWILASDIEQALRQKFPTEKISLSSFPANYSWENSHSIRFTYNIGTQATVLSYELKTKTISAQIASPSAAAETSYAPNNRKAAYLVQNNIEIVDENGQVIQVTQDSNPDIVNGSNYTHRQEFGIDRGMWWSPNAEQLLYYRKDESMVAKYPLINWHTRIASVREIAYPMAGEKSEEVTLVVFNTKTQQKVTLQTGEPKEQYLTSVSWDPSGQYIYVGVLNRGQDHLKLNKYSAADGSLVKTLFEERSSTWVEPQHALLFLPKDPTQFLYQTDIQGYNQLYVYNTEGKLIRNLGYKDVIVQRVLDFNAAGNKISYIGITNHGLDRQLFEVDINSGKTQVLTSISGTHDASSNGKYVLDIFSNTETANEIQVTDIKSQKSNTILKAENPFSGKIDFPKSELIQLTSADGKTPLNGRVIYPNNFDPAKKYPVMVYLYGGSHAQLVTNKWMAGAGYFDYYMAQQGYIVFTMDNRGSDARGRDFTRITHRQLGQAEMEDQLQGIAYLKSKNYVDTERMGIFGWSFGGFMTSSIMLTHPDIFKAAVAGGPVMDWKYYEAMYGERYMDTPQENPQGYQLTSLLNKADQLKGNLLIIHGAQDPVVVQQHSMEFIEACIKAGKQVDYFLYPTHEHNVQGKDRIHMYEKIAKYFNQYLKN